MNPSDHIRQTLELMLSVGSVVEIRGLNCHEGNPDYTHTRIGYFDSDHIEDAVKAAVELETRWNAQGVYITLNPVMFDIRGRAANRLKKAQKGESAKDSEIVKRRWLLVDHDPKRPAGVSATPAERDAAREVARECGRWLQEHGFPRPVIAMSGNGLHLLYQIDLPADDGGLVERILQTLSQKFSTDSVTVDTSVFNPARITKLYGTLTRKGDDTPERPNVRSELVEVPETIEAVPLERLEWLASQYVAPVKTTTRPNASTASSGAVDVEKYLARNNVPILDRDTTSDGATRWFITCPGEADHTSKNGSRDCCITQEQSGALGGKCFHSSCGCRNWESIRDRIGAVTAADFPQSEQTGNRPENQKNGDSWTQTPLNKLENGGLRYATAVVFKTFPFEILPQALAEFCKHHGKSICCDPTLILLPALATGAGLIGNSRRAVVRRNWTEPSILWTCAVADSGSGKSPAFDAATEPAKRLQRIACQSYEQELSQYKSLKSQYDQQQRGKKGFESIPEPVMPELQDIFLDDSTVEAIAPALLARPRGSLVACEELSGWFARLNAYKQKGGGDEAFYLQAFGARPSKINRRTGGKVFIPRASLSITGTIQKGILKSVLSTTHRDSGMAARFMFSMPPEQIRRWSDDEIPRDVIDRYNSMMLKLADLQMAQGEFDDPEPVNIGMTAQAQHRFRQFYDEIGATRPDIETAEMKAAWSKLEGGAVRLALLFACCRFVLGEKSREVIDDQDMEAGITASRWFAHEAERIYSMLVETEQDAELHELVSWIQSQGGEILPTELRSKRRRYRESGAADAVLQTLVNRRFGDWSETSTTPSGGRPSRRFILSASGHVPETPVSQAEKGGLCPQVAKFDDSDPSTWSAQDEVADVDFDEVSRLFGGRPV